MAYEFKKLSAVSTVEAPSADAHVLIEENGSVKRVPKNSVGETAENVIKKVAKVSTVESPAEDAHVLIEENGSVKRVPKNAVGETAESVISKLGTVGSVDSTTDATNVIIEENGEIKRVSKNAVSESVINKLAEVPSTESTTDTTNVLIEEDGVVKKAPKSAVQGKRELVYEFTPGIDADGNPITEIFEFMQNVDDDLSWLTTKNNDVGFEIEVTTYPYYSYWDEENSEDIEIFATDAESKVYANQNSNETVFFNNNTITSSTISAYGRIPYDPIVDINYYYNYI